VVARRLGRGWASARGIAALAAVGALPLSPASAAGMRRPVNARRGFSRSLARCPIPAGHAMTLSTRLTMAMVGLVLFAIAVTGILTYRNLLDVAVPRSLERLGGHVELVDAFAPPRVRGAASTSSTRRAISFCTRIKIASSRLSAVRRHGCRTTIRL